MAHYATPEYIAKLAASATLLLDDDHSKFDGFGLDKTFEGPDARYQRVKYARERASATSPWQPGHIVFVDLDGDGMPPRRVLIDRVDVKWSDHSGEWVNHALGFVESKTKLGWSTMLRHIPRGYITRGFEKARTLGLAPTADPELSERRA